LFIQLQDRFFEIDTGMCPSICRPNRSTAADWFRRPTIPVRNKPVGHGWATQQWNPAVRERYQRLLAALARKFDGRVYGINLPESAIDIDIKNDRRASPARNTSRRNSRTWHLRGKLS
jgi:hypothetical protein